MANELNATAQLAWANSARNVSESYSGRFNVTGDNPVTLFPTATTSWAALSLPSNFGTPGWALFKNLDATNYVEIGNNNSGTPITFAKLKPGEFWFGRLAMAKDQIAVRANTASCDLEVNILED